MRNLLVPGQIRERRISDVKATFFRKRRTRERNVNSHTSVFFERCSPPVVSKTAFLQARRLLIEVKRWNGHCRYHMLGITVDITC